MRSYRSLALVLVLFSALTSANAALAATLVNSSPAAGAMVTTAPTQITITADGSLAEMGNSLLVTGPEGTRVDDGSLQISGATALVGVKSLTRTGLYTVTYQLILSDGQNLNGSYTFTLIGITSSPTTATSSPTPSETSPTQQNSTFLDRLKGGGVGLLLIALILIVVGSRVASSRRNHG